MQEMIFFIAKIRLNTVIARGGIKAPSAMLKCYHASDLEVRRQRDVYESWILGANTRGQMTHFA